jgi:biopolymer transport protein ExbD
MSFNPERGGLKTTLSEINVTPLVDVMLVLLIIFMVTAPMLQTKIGINLPKAATGTQPKSSDAVLAVTKDRYIYLNDRPVNLFLLEETLKNYFAGSQTRILFLKADKSLSYGYVIEVMDLIKKAGVETVGLIVEPVTAKKR